MRYRLLVHGKDDRSKALGMLMTMFEQVNTSRARLLFWDTVYTSVNNPGTQAKAAKPPDVSVLLPPFSSALQPLLEQCSSSPL